MLTTTLQRPELVSAVLSGAPSQEKLTWVTREASSKTGIWELLGLLLRP